MPSPASITVHRSFLARLSRAQSGNVLAITAAAVFPLIGMVGGAIDMSRAYMTKARMQQACDAGALAARRSMGSQSAITDATKNIGYKFFDFNFKNGDYGSTLSTREYSQPTSTGGKPQAIINGRAEATVPATLMRVFGFEQIPISVQCSSRMDIVNADVAMVLDVTGSMGTAMPIKAGASGTETRLSALRKSVKAFYDTLGPGRAGGDLSKGRIRYAFVPYGTAVNSGYLISNDQMVDRWDYYAPNYVKVVYGWTAGAENVPAYSGWSPASAPSTVINNSKNRSNYTGANSTFSGGGTLSYTRIDGSAATADYTAAASNSAACDALNTWGSGSSGMRDALIGVPGTVSETVGAWNPSVPTYTSAAVNTAQQTRTYSGTRTVATSGIYYSWASNKCSLNLKVGGSNVNYNQTATKVGSKPITWTSYDQTQPQNQPVFATRSLDVSALKAGGSTWNTTISVPTMALSGPTTTIPNITLSGSNTPTNISTGGTTSVNVNWRGCLEERGTDPTINSTTSIDSIPADAIDLNITVMSNIMMDATRWKPWLPGVSFKSGGTSGGTPNPPRALAADSYCPSPAIRLQEIGDWASTPLTSDYPNLFQTSSGAPASLYYPYDGSAVSATRSAQNYIDRIAMVDGTLHDVGFLWGLHLISNDGMFGADNPDEFNTFTVNRNIVFMTDGEMNPAEDRYGYTGYNMNDGRVAPKAYGQTQMIPVHNRRLRILCESAKRQGITVWVVAITASATSGEDYSDLRACATAPANFKSAATSSELIASFTTIAQSIGGLRLAS